MAWAGTWPRRLDVFPVPAGRGFWVAPEVKLDFPFLNAMEGVDAAY
jgi:hypothetical protein